MKTLPTARACSSLTFAFGCSAPVDPEDCPVDGLDDDELPVVSDDTPDSLAEGVCSSSGVIPSKGTMIGSGIWFPIGRAVEGVGSYSKFGCGGGHGSLRASAWVAPNAISAADTVLPSRIFLTMYLYLCVAYSSGERVIFLAMVEV